MTRFAAIDCGTNAIRLLVADVVDGQLVEIVRHMRTVRLGEGIDSTGELSQAALERTFTAVEDYASEMHDLGVDIARMVATSASRDARNADQFTEGVRRRLEIEPEVITGAEEAELSFAGAVRGLPSAAIASPVLVVDIGGGSTEFVLGEDSRIQASVSVDVGCVRMTERHLPGDPPTTVEIANAVETIDATIDVALSQCPIDGIRSFVGLAGSVTTVAALAHGLSRYDAAAIHGSVTSLSQVERVTAELLAMTRNERAALPVMHPGRVDVIGGGALVLRQILRRLPVSTVIASETDLLDGIVYSLAAKVA